NTAATGNPVHLGKELILLHRARGRIDRGRLLRQRWRRPRDDNHERQRADDETSVCKPVRHETAHATASLFLCPAKLLFAGDAAASLPRHRPPVITNMTTIKS